MESISTLCGLTIPLANLLFSLVLTPRSWRKGEVLHLSAAVQYSGYQSVIGILWGNGRLGWWGTRSHEYCFVVDVLGEGPYYERYRGFHFLRLLDEEWWWKICCQLANSKYSTHLSPSWCMFLIIPNFTIYIQPSSTHISESRTITQRYKSQDPMN